MDEFDETITLSWHLAGYASSVYEEHLENAKDQLKELRHAAKIAEKNGEPLNNRSYKTYPELYKGIEEAEAAIDAAIDQVEGFLWDALQNDMLKPGDEGYVAEGVETY